MILETKKQPLMVSQIIGNKKLNIIAEGDAIIPDVKPDIINVVSTNGVVTVYKKEILDSKVRIDGNVEVYVIYHSNSETGVIRGFNTSIDFSEAIEFSEVTPEMFLDEYITLKEIECKVLNERKISVKAYLNVELKVEKNNKIEVLDSIDNDYEIQFARKNVRMNALVGKGSQKVSVKDTISTGEFFAAEILKVDMNIVNKDIKLSYNKVLAKADAYTKIMYLTEEGTIEISDLAIPIMGFIDMDDLTDDMICDTKYDIKNILVKLGNIDERNITIEAEVEISAKAYQNRDVDIVDDMYSPFYEMQFDNQVVKCSEIAAIKTENFQLKQVITNDKFIDCKIMDVKCSNMITEKKILTDRLIVVGEINLFLLLQNTNTNRLEEITLKLPFEYKSEIKNIKTESEITCMMEHDSIDVIMLANGEAEITLNSKIYMNVMNSIEFHTLDKVTVAEEKIENKSSLIIYYVKRGDSLWSIAKQYKSSKEEIAKVNEIEVNAVLKEGTRLFIPKIQYKRAM